MIGKQSIGGSSTKVLDKNTTRNILYLSNDSNEDIYIAIGEPAILNQGIILQVGARPFIMRIGDPGMKEQINAICSTGGKNLAWSQL